MSESIKEVKERLEAMGLSTATPGLKGDLRRQELINRLEEALMSHETEPKEKASTYIVPSMADLSMAELRSRLTMLGESSATPGLSGDERRAELMKRLINAICRNDVEDNSETDAVDTMVQSLAEKEFVNLPSRTTPPAHVSVEDKVAEFEDNIEKRVQMMRKEERVKTTELNEVKKRLNNLMNRRSAVISSRFAGPKQDPRLGDSCVLHDQIEAEISRITNLKQKQDKGGKKSLLTSPLVDNGNATTAEKILIALEKSQIDVKDKIKRQKLRIRCEEEANDLYGLEAEDCEQSRLQELNFEISKIKRDIEKVLAGGHVNSQAKTEEKMSESNKILSNSSADSTIKINKTYQLSRAGSGSHGNLEEEADDDQEESGEETDNEWAHAKQSRTIENHEDRSVATQKIPVAPSVSTRRVVDLNEDDLAAIKPFKPYHDENDDVLAMKMEMLRNRHREDKSKTVLLASAAAAAPLQVPQSAEAKESQRSGGAGRTSLGRGGGGEAVSAFQAARRANRVMVPSRQVQADDSSSSKDGAVENKDTSEKVGVKAVGAVGIDSDRKSDATHIPENEQSQEHQHHDSIHMETYDETIPKAKPSLLEAPIHSTTLVQDEEEDDGQESEESEEEDEDELRLQLKALRDHALVLQEKGDVDGVEELYVRAISLVPTDVRTLDVFATFLHRRKGEMARAEAFYRRGIQVCLPSLINDLQLTPRPGKSLSHDWNRLCNHEREATHTEAPPSANASNGVSVRIITSLLLNYASFLRRAKGDLEMAEVVLRRAAEIAPTNAAVLGTCAHHLAEQAYGHHGDNDPAVDTIEKYRIDAANMFSVALRADPANVTNILWYAKFLHKTKKYAQAEIMFKVALQNSKGGKHEATAICNYAVFLYRNKKRPEEAAALFCDGLDRYPTHRGLNKNFQGLKKELMRARGNGHSAVTDSTPPIRIADRSVEVVMTSIQEEENANQNRGGTASSQSSRQSVSGGGMRAKLYQDINAAASTAPDVEDFRQDASGLMMVFFSKVVCVDMKLSRGDSEKALYWTVQWGKESGMSYQAPAVTVESRILKWEFSPSSTGGLHPPNMRVGLDDHLCFDFYQCDSSSVEADSGPIIDGEFVGSSIYPIEELVVSNDLTEDGFHHFEEVIGNDSGETVGKFEAYVKFVLA